MKSRFRFLVLVGLFVSVLSSFGSTPTWADDPQKETAEHLVAACAKWGVVKIILDELWNPEFEGGNDSRAGLSYFCRQVSNVAAPALARWVIRPEKKFLGREVESALDAVHARLEGFDLSIGFCNSPDIAIWKKGEQQMGEIIKKGTADATAVFNGLKCPRIRLSPDFEREVIRDELRIISAFLVNQDEDHRWTPTPKEVACPRPEELKRVAVLHSQVLHIGAKMIEYVVSNRNALPQDSQQKLAKINHLLVRNVETSLRVIRKGGFDWQVMHKAFHAVIDEAYHDIDEVWGEL